MMSAIRKPILYSFWISSCAWRVRLVLNLKEIPYEIRSVDLVKNGQHSNEFSDVNPMKQVPVLHIDDHTLIESLNIMQYLEETRPDIPLMPSDMYQRAQVRQICEIITAGIQPLQNLCVLTRVSNETEIRSEWAQHFINRGFKAIEALLNSSAGKYCVGNDITLADCCLIPQVFNARSKFGVDLNPYPNILRIDKELENHVAFKKAHPYNQPDYPHKVSA